MTEQLSKFAKGLQIPRSRATQAWKWESSTRPFWVFPGVDANLERDRYAEMNIYTVEQIHLECAKYQATSKDGFLDMEHTYPGPVSKLLTLPGSHPSRASIFPLDNSDTASSVKPDELDLHCFDSICKLLFSGYKPESIALKNTSTTGFPAWIKKSEEKSHQVVKLNDNWDHVTELFSAKEWEKLSDQYAVCMAYHPVSRLQPDAHKVDFSPDGRIISVKRKERMVYSYETQNHTVLADNKIPGMPFMATCRERSAAGLGMGANIPLRILATSFTNYYSNAFDFTYKHRGLEHVASKIESYGHGRSWDCKQFDRSIPTWLINRLRDNMPISPKAKEWMHMAWHAPFLRTGDSASTAGQIRFDGDPGHPEIDMDKRNYGNPSGAGTVTLKNHVAGTWLWLTSLFHARVEAGLLTMKEALSTPIGEIAVLLKGEHEDFADLNAGDDMVILFSTDTMKSLLLPFMLKHANKFFQVEEEDLIQFLGGMFIKERSTGKVTGCPHLWSLLVNSNVPEYGMELFPSKNKPADLFWPIGCEAEAVYYGKHPLYQVVSAIRDRAYMKFFNVDRSKIWQDALVKLRMSDTTLTDMTKQEMVFMLNPDAIYYKVRPEDVRPEIYDLMFRSIQPERFENITKWIFDNSQGDNGVAAPVRCEADKSSIQRVLDDYLVRSKMHAAA